MNDPRPAKLLLKILPCVFLMGGMLNCTAPTKKPINYLGQQSPGLTAAVFAPGLISTKTYEHSSPAFSPDGRVVLWTVVDKTYRGALYEMKFENGKWSAPHRPSFADTTADDYYPSFSIDGKKLYFSSRRKMPEGYPDTKDMCVWEVERNENGWGTPIPFDTVVSSGVEYAHSVTENGTLYFSSSMGGGTSFNIRKSGNLNGKYARPVLLPYNINSVGYEDGPYIAPDESYLIFESNRPESGVDNIDLFISFRTAEGSWTLPKNMGPQVNTPKAERFARLSPDGKYLFFGSNRTMSEENWGFDIYWIDASFIAGLKNETTTLDQSVGDDVIHALYKEDTEGSAHALSKWINLYPENLDAKLIYASVLRKQSRFQEAEQLIINSLPDWNNHANTRIEMALIMFGRNQANEANRILSIAAGNLSRDQFFYLAQALFAMSKFEESDMYFDKAMAIYTNLETVYHRGQSYAKVNQNERAFRYLYWAAEQGYNSRQQYESDPDLRSLKSDNRWKQLLEKLK
jgi:Tol biopolymer transport system component